MLNTKSISTKFVLGLSALLIAVFALFVFTSSAYAIDTTQPCKGVQITGGSCSNSSLDGIVKAAINILSIGVGIVSVIMIIIGGLKYIMSSGDSNNINSAKNTILYAIIGLVIVAAAQVIVAFVLTSASSAGPSDDEEAFNSHLLERVV